MADQNEPPLLLQYLFGESAQTALQGASPRLLRWAEAFDDWLAQRAGQVTPGAGLTPMLKGVLAALIGGLGSLRGAVIGGFALGLAEVLLRSRLPDDIAGLTDLYRGLAEDKLGRKDNLINDLDQFVRLAPNSPEAETARAILSSVR